MEDKISIAELLLKHHSYIEALYEDFKKKNNLGTDYEQMRESFNILEQNLKNIYPLKKTPFSSFAIYRAKR